MPSRPLRPLAVAFGITLAATLAHAQSDGVLNGTWAGTATSPSTGNPVQFDVEIKGAVGTWRYTIPAEAKRAGACFGREFPLELRLLSPTRYAVTVDGAKVITGCPVFALTLERVNETTLEGSFGDGRPAKLVRQ